MKKQVLSIVFCLLVIFASSSIKAQTFTGLHASTFGGVSNVSYNPAIADNHFKFDMNIIGVNAKATNNYMGFIDCSIYFQLFLCDDPNTTWPS